MRQNVKDKMDGARVAWFVGQAMPGETCLYCGDPSRKGSAVLVERTLPGINVRPHVLHKRCWPAHVKRTLKAQRAAEQEAAVVLADKVF